MEEEERKKIKGMLVDSQRETIKEICQTLSGILISISRIWIAKEV
jgi:hypothetical protein